MSPNKKVTKEIGIGEALSVALPRAKDALSYVPLPSRIIWPLEGFIGQNLFSGCGFTEGGLFHDVRPADFSARLPFGQKIGTFFVRTGSKVKRSSAIVNARRGFPKGAALRAGAPSFSAPLVAFFWYFSWRSKKSTLRTYQ